MAIDQLKNAIDIVKYIDQFTSLSKRGNLYKGLCPLHSGDTDPSLAVWPEDQHFYCFGCHEGGDVLDFAQVYHGWNFKEALYELAEQYNVDIERPSATIRDILYDATQYYHSKVARVKGFLFKRGLSENTIEKYKLGYADGNLFKNLSSAYAIDDLVASGLVKISSDGSIYDLLRNRVAIPIWGASGIVSMSGRALNGGTPKYLNTPNTSLFTKKNTLFGMYMAKKHLQDGCNIVEGYFDQMVTWQKYPNTVASMGTVISTGQLEQIAQYTNHINLIMDGDAAGYEAVLRSYKNMRDVFLSKSNEILPDISGVYLRIVQVEGDPDEAVLNGTMDDAMQNAEPFAHYIYRVAQEKYDTPQQVANAVSKALSLINNQAEQEIQAGEISNKFGVSKDALLGTAQESNPQRKSDDDNNFEYNVEKLVIDNCLQYGPYLLLLINNGLVYNDLSTLCKGDFKHLTDSWLDIAERWLPLEKVKREPGYKEIARSIIKAIVGLRIYRIRNDLKRMKQVENNEEAVERINSKLSKLYRFKRRY